MYVYSPCVILSLALAKFVQTETRRPCLVAPLMRTFSLFSAQEKLSLGGPPTGTTCELALAPPALVGRIPQFPPPPGWLLCMPS